MEQLLADDFVDKNKRSSFYYSFLLLPKPKREAINIVYAWCRVADDIVDEERRASPPSASGCCNGPGNSNSASPERRAISWSTDYRRSSNYSTSP
jgi:hypothetical protein